MIRQNFIEGFLWSGRIVKNKKRKRYNLLNYSLDVFFFQLKHYSHAPMDSKI